MTRHKFTILIAMALVGFFSVSNRGLAQAVVGGVKQPQANAGFRPMTYADLERLYLDGKITAKQYQKFLNDMKSHPTDLMTPSVTTPSRPTAVAPTTNATAMRPTTNAPAVTPPPNKGEQISSVEAKMDELLKAKAAREKAATNTPPTVSTGPKTKRDRLNELLRQYIEGKISEPEMNERRAKIIAEPE
jgi:hypothetical protein